VLGFFLGELILHDRVGVVIDTAGFDIGGDEAVFIVVHFVVNAALMVAAGRDHQTDRQQ
jgi:hypothetical protein